MHVFGVFVCVCTLTMWLRSQTYDWHEAFSSPAGCGRFPLLHLLHHLQQAINLSQGQFGRLVCQTGSGRAARTPIRIKRQVGRPGSFPKQLQGLTVGKAGCRLVAARREGKMPVRSVNQLFDSDVMERRWAQRRNWTVSRTCNLI